jgi:hypothetical protein
VPQTYNTRSFECKLPACLLAAYARCATLLAFQATRPEADPDAV